MEYCRHRRRPHFRQLLVSSGPPLMLRASLVVFAFVLLSCSGSNGARILDEFYTEEFGVADAPLTDQLGVPPVAGQLQNDRDEYEEDVPRGGHSLLRGVSFKEENARGNARRLPPSPPIAHDFNPCPVPPTPDVQGYMSPLRPPPRPPGKDKGKDEDKDKDKEDKEDKKKGTTGDNSLPPPPPSSGCTVPDT